MPNLPGVETNCQTQIKGLQISKKEGDQLVFPLLVGFVTNELKLKPENKDFLNGAIDKLFKENTHLRVDMTQTILRPVHEATMHIKDFDELINFCLKNYTHPIYVCEALRLHHEDKNTQERLSINLATRIDGERVLELFRVINTKGDIDRWLQVPKLLCDEFITLLGRIDNL